MDRSFTMQSEGGLLSYLATVCHVNAFDPAVKVATTNDKNRFAAMWDTGCTASVITPRVVEALGLEPIKAVRPISISMQGVNGLEKSQAYLVNIHLPGKIIAREFMVFLKDPGDAWWDVLIGMDIISRGNLTVSNVNSNTEWTFSIVGDTKAE